MALRLAIAGLGLERGGGGGEPELGAAAVWWNGGNASRY
jgi:hypothetical protein